MYQISDATGKLKFTTVLEGKLDISCLDSNDVFLVDTGNHLYVWIGEGTLICRVYLGDIFFN